MQIVCRDVVIQEVPKYNKMYRDVVTRKVPKRKQNILRTKGMSELAPLPTTKQLRIAHTTFACSYISKTGHIYNHIRSDNVQVCLVSPKNYVKPYKVRIQVYAFLFNGCATTSH